MAITHNITPKQILDMIAAGFTGSAGHLFDSYITQIVLESNKLTAEATTIAKENIGYMSANYPDEVALKAEEQFECYHPVFGKTVERRALTQDECLKSGMWLAKLNQAGWKLEDTLLYYPHRIHITIPMLLAEPSLDHLLNQIPQVTQEELEDGIKKIEVFNQALNEDIQKTSPPQAKSGLAAQHAQEMFGDFSETFTHGFDTGGAVNDPED